MKILFILSRFPFPLEKGDKLRAYHQIKNLSKKHEVTVFALNDGDIDQGKITHVMQVCSRIEVYQLSRLTIWMNMFKALFSNMPLQIGYFYSPNAQKKLNELIAELKPDHIFCQLIRTAEYAKKHEGIPKTLDYMDVFSKGFERRLSTAALYLRPVFKMEFMRLARYEKNIFSYFKNKIIISEQDRDLIPHPEKDKIMVISNGVDTKYFKPINKEKEFDILFNGNMHYPPNIESAEYLVHKVLPLVRKKHPEVKLLISGTNPNKRILSLASDSVKISGWVRDIRENFSRSRMLVAPMFMSIGLQNKLLEAMAMQIPCITSTLANNALGAEKGKSILIADTPEEYADHIISLMEDVKKAQEIALNGHNFVLERYNWQRETEKLEKLILT